jgi:DeoR family fructose operon transcriptional repressor
MITAGRRVVVLADSTKLGRESMVRFGSLDRVDALVTDSGVDPKMRSALEDLDIDVVIA